MKKNLKDLIKEFFYSVGSNLIGTVISAMLVLIVPKFISVEQYGYWQIAVFYFSYIAFFHFGWADGAYLRYGGAIYEKLDKGIFKNQFYALTIFEFIFASVVVALAFLLPIENHKKYIFIAFGVGCLLQLPGTFLRLILQATGKIKEYSQNILVDKIGYASLLFLFIFLGGRNYKILILADVFGRLITSLHAIYLCKDIVFTKETCYKDITVIETKKNLSVGSKLLFANLTSMLIIGIVRIGIEHTWDVATFGKVSLTLSISNFVMIFVSAISMIIFPILRRTESSNLVKIYQVLRSVIMTFIVGILLFYFPMKFLLLKWLPNYADSLAYMAILFPICIFEGKNTLLIMTYLKTYRKEKVLLNVNIITSILSLILTILFTKWSENINLAVFGIVIVLAFRCILSEMMLAKIINVKVRKSILCESVCALIFIVSNVSINSGLLAFAVYFITYSVYIFVNYKDIKNSFVLIKKYLIS